MSLKFTRLDSGSVKVVAPAVILLVLAGCAAPASVPTPDQVLDLVPAYVTAFNWTTQASLGSVNLGLAVQPSMWGLCTLITTVTGYMPASGAIYYLFHENLTVKRYGFGGGYFGGYGFVHHDDVDTRPVRDEIFEVAYPGPNSMGIRNDKYVFETDGTPFRVWLFFPSVEPSVPDFSRNSLALNLACDAPFKIDHLKGGKEQVEFSFESLQNGTGASVLLSMVARENGFDTRFASPTVEFFMWTRDQAAVGTMLLERPNGRDQWTFEPAPPPTYYRATDGPGDYRLRMDRVDVLGGGAGVLGGLRPMVSMDDILSW